VVHSASLTLAIVLAFAYVSIQIIADITVCKMVMFAGLVIPAGSLLYAISFTLRDIVHKSLGKKAARQMIVLAAAVNSLMAVWFIIVGAMEAPPFWTNQEAYDLILGIMPRVVAASIFSEMVSELTDTELYHLWVTYVTRKYQWTRVLVSNGIAAPMDALIFGGLAFYGTMPLAALWAIIKGGAIFKWAVSFVSLPLIYIVKGE
jgi:uncharacterized integral membrane protein (TIGR00697 family)